MNHLQTNKVTEEGTSLLYKKSPVELYDGATQLVQRLFNFLCDAEEIESILFEDEVVQSIQYFVQIKKSNALLYSWFQSTCDLSELLYQCHQNLYNKTSDCISCDYQPLKDSIENSRKQLEGYNVENLAISQNLWKRSYHRGMMKALNTQNSSDCSTSSESTSSLSLRAGTFG